jgi:hypothetical protein
MYIYISAFRNPYNAYYKALTTNAVTSALRLYQRIPRVTPNREFLSHLLHEDSFHYLFYALIFLYVTPVTCILFLYAMQNITYEALSESSWTVIVVTAPVKEEVKGEVKVTLLQACQPCGTPL